MIVFDIPLLVPFRGVTRRQGILFEGEAGWAEWSPFREYGDEEAASWLRASVAAAREGHPEPLRDHVAVNGIIPAIGPAEVGKRTLATRLGDSGTRVFFVALLVAGAVSVLGVMALSTPWAGLGLLGFVLVLGPAARLLGGAIGRDLIAMLQATSFTELAMAAGLLLGAVVGR